MLNNPSLPQAYNCYVTYDTCIFHLFQAKAFIAFCSALIESLMRRGEGVAATGGRMGTANKDLLEMMTDIRYVENLEGIRSAKTPSHVPLMLDAIELLVSRRIIPPSARASGNSIS